MELEQAESPVRVEIRRSPTKRPVLDASLALASEGVRHWIEYSGDDFLLTVEAPDAARAGSLLEKYEAENDGYRVEDPEVAPFELYLSPFLHLAIPALFSFWATAETWGYWMETRGGAIAGRILGEGSSGIEWWRVLTATTLHADSEHFLGNMLSGYFIFNLLRRRCGPGTSMLLLTFAAALTNTLVAALSPPYYRSIGFSTVVFAGLGMLAAAETRFFPNGLRPGLRNFTPLLGAFFLAVMNGLGENADVKAHFIGFACGVLCAPVMFWLGRRGFEKPRWQVAGVLATYAAYAAAWWAAIG
ncbi:MAG TPA: rhomboid family intramembrane serine protease [Fibrobacteria bacterium]|nr:rhomboid family intramembrane serine protease [Fibrobacteria bacterium]